MPRVSIIIPTFNRAELLRLTVESVLSQTYPQIEVIVIDDGSLDHTAQVVASFSDSVTYVRQENQGTDAAFATGYSIASGTYINFLDHDDLMLPTKIELQVEVLNKHPEIDIVHCGYHHIDADGKVLQRAIALPDKDPVQDLLEANFIWSGAPLIRRSCLDDVGLFDESISCSDWDLWLRIALAGYRFRCIQQPLGAYRIVPQSAMSNVVELESGIVATLDKAFAHHNLPVRLHATRSKSYGRIYFELAARYFIANDVENGKRCLGLFATYCPEELTDGDVLMERVTNEILKNPRVHNPERVIELLVANLPANGGELLFQAPRMLSAAHTVSAMKDYQQQAIDSAQQHMRAAARFYPEMLDKSIDFANMLTASAFSLPVSDPFQFVAYVMDNLPSEAKELRRYGAKISGDLHIIAAFQAYASAHWEKIPGHVMRGVLGQPSSLKNRGVYSISLKSMRQMLRRGNSQKIRERQLSY